MGNRVKEKNSKLYLNAIKVWTGYDVKKLHTAEENNLNYLTFYTLKECLEWLSSLKDKQYYYNIKFKNKEVNDIWHGRKNRNEIVQ